ncbi:MAG: SpoIVB peptidase [Clostridia bacterium]|jgi:stage IV sporulation protein B|nr:SpoIVB peptidase [Clostridia bacterium]
MKKIKNSFLFVDTKTKWTNIRVNKFCNLILPLLLIIIVSALTFIGTRYSNALLCTQVNANLSANAVILEQEDPIFFSFFGKKEEQKPENTERVMVYAGGYPVGFILQGDGVTIVGTTDVETVSGTVNTLIKCDIKAGDIIKKIQGENILSSEHITEIINTEENAGKELTIELCRNDKIITTKLTPALEVQSQKYKLGVWVRDDMSGVGTLTYVRADNSRFGALGHPVCDSDTGGIYNVKSGDMYASNIISITKGKKGKAGELRGMFLQGKSVQGEVDKNCKFGVFGVITECSPYYNDENLMPIGLKNEVKIGKAQIIACIDGKEPERYDIEIVKLNSQNKSASKGLVIKVTDKDLLSKTGGIVQGMSGSPIIQNGKLVGAVTHVFVNDPSRGYGIYVDWMINK